ncbi:MAG: TolC family protein [Planctomycetes bacterium]|nr:TolC family protein [Planctomycetota bacterium]
MRRECAAIVFVLLAGCASVKEPVLPPPPAPELAAQPLTRARCVELALESVPNAATWRARLERAQAALAGAKRLPNPSLALNFEDFGIPGIASSAPVQTTLMLGEALADVASRKRRTRAAEHELAAEEARLVAERDQLAAEVSAAYDELVAARARVEIDAELTQIAQTQQTAVARFVEVGESPRLELEKAQAELLDAQMQAARDESAARAREIELAFALGFERPLSLALSEELTPALAQEHEGLEAQLERATQRSPALGAAKEDYEAALERAHLAASGVRFLPTVRAGPRTVGGDTLAVAEIETELPLFDQRQSERSAASAELLAAAAAVRAAAHELARSVSIASAAITAARTRLEEQAQPLAEQRASIRARTQQQFEAGEASYLELVNARRDEVQARAGVLEAQLELAHARTELARVLGNP